MTKITYGADPEFFVREKSTGTIIPACGLFGGDKGAPILLSGEGGYLEDGVTIEINVAPKSTVAELTKSILGLKALWEQRFPQHTLVCSAAAQFAKAELRKHRKAMEIGCNADMCAWGIRRAPQIRDFGLSRFAGGHIHVGMDPWPEEFPKEFLIRWLDVFALSARYSDPSRFEHYGRPGLWRETTYGVEWRSPDPEWIMSGKVAIHTEKAVTALIGARSNAAKVIERFEDLVTLHDIRSVLERPVITQNELPTMLRLGNIANTHMERVVGK